MYYFYINFPTFKKRSILLHKGECGDCQMGMGKHNVGSNEKGFWAGPFREYEHAASALKKIRKKFRNPPKIGACSCMSD